MNYQYMFTVFTATYNRRYTLQNVYESLSVQTYKNFEWIIVDDGSSDSTKDLVMRWQSEGKVRIKYFYQENQGKPSAHNRGVQESSGELFLVLDSDDTCRREALERFLFHWQDIPLSERAEFSGVTCHCVDTKGRPIGSPFPADVIDMSPIEMYFKNRVKGEKWGFHRTDVLREFPFPQFTGEKFIPEGLIWNRIARVYKMRFISEGLRTFNTNSDGLSSSLVRLRVLSPQGMRIYYQECLNLPMPRSQKLKVLINYLRSSLHAGISWHQALIEIDNAAQGIFRQVSIPFAYLLFRLDHIRSKGTFK